MKPAISIIVPAYNTGKYIDLCIKSILNQTFTDFEVIIVDDGSTDDTSAICDKYAAEDPRIRVIHQKNGGVSAARNKGLDEARGEFVSFCDSDDYYHPQLLELLHASLVKHPEVEFVEGLLSRIAQYREPELISVSQEQDITLSSEDYFRNMFAIFRYASVCAKLIRKSSLETIRFKKTALEDVTFSSMLFSRKEKSIFVPHILYFYLQRPGSQLHQENKVPRFVYEMASWEELYLNCFKEKDELIRSFILKRIYKQIITRYNPFNNHTEIRNSVKKLTNATSQDYYNNRQISFSLKISTRILLRFPCLYNSSKNIYEWYFRKIRREKIIKDISR